MKDIVNWDDLGVTSPDCERHVSCCTEHKERAERRKKQKLQLATNHLQLLLLLFFYILFTMVLREVIRLSVHPLWFICNEDFIVNLFHKMKLDYLFSFSYTVVYSFFLVLC